MCLELAACATGRKTKLRPLYRPLGRHWPELAIVIVRPLRTNGAWRGRRVFFPLVSVGPTVIAVQTQAVVLAFVVRDFVVAALADFFILANQHVTT